MLPIKKPAISQKASGASDYKAGACIPASGPPTTPHTCVIPDVAGFEAQGSAAQREAVGPLPTPSTSRLQKLLRIVIPGLK